jgi:hypothetical protein
MRRTYELLHRLRITPWVDHTPPAVLAAAVTGSTALAPGIAVDLGCGTGGHARYVAGLGWTTTAVDYVETAVRVARRRDGAGRVSWRVADVTRPDQVDPDGTLAGRVRLLLDAGCLHGLPPADRTGWAATVAHLAGPTATLLLRAAPPGRRGIGPAGIAAPEIATLLPAPWRPIDQRDGWHRFDRTPVHAALFGPEPPARRRDDQPSGRVVEA